MVNIITELSGKREMARQLTVKRNKPPLPSEGILNFYDIATASISMPTPLGSLETSTAALAGKLPWKNIP